LIDFIDYCSVRKLELSEVTLEQIAEIAERIITFTEGRRVFLFYAEMGAGKTTLIKAMCAHLGSRDNFSSPSYSVVNEYLISSSPPAKIYHIDLYRIKDIEEALSIGIEEYLHSGNNCFVEWPELIEDYLPEDHVKIHITGHENVRNVSIFIR
jgi:tRNA threonylcarbamoyladenosine biosynthesis protein TsaE